MAKFGNPSGRGKSFADKGPSSKSRGPSSDPKNGTGPYVSHALGSQLLRQNFEPDEAGRRIRHSRYHQDSDRALAAGRYVYDYVEQTGALDLSPGDDTDAFRDDVYSRAEYTLKNEMKMNARDTKRALTFVMESVEEVISENEEAA